MTPGPQDVQTPCAFLEAKLLPWPPHEFIYINVDSGTSHTVPPLTPLQEPDPHQQGPCLNQKIISAVAHCSGWGPEPRCAIGAGGCGFLLDVPCASWVLP